MLRALQDLQALQDRVIRETDWGATDWSAIGDGLAGGDANRQGSDADRASGQKRQVRGLASASLSLASHLEIPRRQRHLVPSRLVKLAATLKQLDEADDADDVKSTVIELIVAAEMGKPAARRLRKAIAAVGSC